MILSFIDKKENYVPINQTFQLSESIKRGAIIYQKKCARCHQKNGEGKKKKYPPLAKSDFLINKRKQSISAVKFGLKKEILVNNVLYKKKMPKSRLKATEIADVMNYITNSWGNKNENIISVKEVEDVSKEE
ncbi:MAG: cytochrome c [Polaribacter sp.]